MPGASNKMYKGKRKVKKKRSLTLIGLPEPPRESLYDILCDNLRQARRNIYVNRIIYVGEHSIQFDGSTGVSDVFRDIVKIINSSYNDERLTGIFLHYQKYFVHMLEGSDDSIIKHFRLLIQNEEVYSKFSKMKLVLLVNHINQRFINEWLDIPGKPATLLEKIDPNCDMEKSNRYIINCVQKVYQLCLEIRGVLSKISEEDSESIDFQKEVQPTAVSLDSGYFEELLKAYYPEINLLQFLVQTRFLKDLNSYFNIYGNPVVPDSYQDKVWPIPNTMVPYFIFERPKNICVDLPSHKGDKIDDSTLDEEGPGEEAL